MTKSQITYPDHGPTIWVAEADRSQITSDIAGRDGRKVTWAMQGVKCYLYQQGKQTLRVEAASGTAVLENHAATVSLAGDVTAYDLVRGARLTADQFDWQSQRDRVSAVNVALFQGGLTHRASRGIFNTPLTHAEFSGDVVTTSDGQPGGR